MDRQALKTELYNREVPIEFLKIKDGGIRVMRATLNPALISVQYNEAGKSRPENPELCAVWDMDVLAWRSFRYENLRKIDGKDFSQGL